jgi:FtsH-binding integral membrane protein
MLGLQVDILPLVGPDIRVGAGSAFGRTASADITLFGHMLYFLLIGIAGINIT